MSIDDLASLEGKLPHEQLIRFIVSLGFNLTVTARNAYRVGSDEVDSAVILRGINEIEHRVLSKAMHLLAGTQDCPYESFVTQIIELANHYGCQFELQNAVMFALERVSIKEGHSGTDPE